MMNNNTANEFNISTYLLEECNIKKGRKDKIALYFKDKTFTYGNVLENVNKCANFMKKLGIAKGHKIGFYMQDCPEYVFLFLAAMKSGVVPVITNPKMDLGTIQMIVDSTKLSYIFTDEGLIGNLDGISNDLLININTDTFNYKELDDQFEAVKTHEEDISFMLFTSGSSGKPKGVLHSHGNMLSVINRAGKYIFETQESDLFYCHSRMSYAFGLGGTIYLPFSQGASAIINNDDSIYEILNILEKFPVTEFIAVPSVYLSILGLIKGKEHPFKSCRKFIAGGEPISKSLSTTWKEMTGTDIHLGYGQTETLFMVAVNDAGEEHYGAMGKALPGYEIRVEKENGEPAAIGELGNIVLYGSNFMIGYWNNEDLTASVLGDDYLFTGDMGYYDKDGFLWYAGRSTDTFKVNGAWQSALPIEEVILTDDNVNEAVVTNESNEERNSDIVAYLVLYDMEQAEETVKAIKRTFFKKQMRSLCPKTFYIAKELPRGATGKLKRGSVSEAEIFCVL